MLFKYAHIVVLPTKHIWLAPGGTPTYSLQNPRASYGGDKVILEQNALVVQCVGIVMMALSEPHLGPKLRCAVVDIGI